MFAEIDHMNIQSKPQSDSDWAHKEVYSFKIIYFVEAKNRAEWDCFFFDANLILEEENFEFLDVKTLSWRI